MNVRKTIMNNTLALLLGFCALFLVTVTYEPTNDIDTITASHETRTVPWPTPSEFLEEVELAPYVWEPHDEPNQYPDLLKPVPLHERRGDHDVVRYKQENCVPMETTFGTTIYSCPSTDNKDELLEAIYREVTKP